MNNYLYPIQARAREIKIIPFQFTINGGNPTEFGSKGVISSIVRNSAGLYSVQLDFGFPKILGNLVTVESASFNRVGGLLSTTNAPSGLIELQINNPAGSATDPATGDVVKVVLVIQNTQSEF
jgi:hypothetical protein